MPNSEHQIDSTLITDTVRLQRQITNLESTVRAQAAIVCEQAGHIEGLQHVVAGLQPILQDIAKAMLILSQNAETTHGNVQKLADECNKHEQSLEHTNDEVRRIRGEVANHGRCIDRLNGPTLIIAGG